mgnify:CR=1 FL=1
MQALAETHKEQEILRQQQQMVIIEQEPIQIQPGIIPDKPPQGEVTFFMNLN